MPSGPAVESGLASALLLPADAAVAGAEAAIEITKHR